MENKKQRIYKSIMLIALTAFITFILTSLYLYKYIEKQDLVVGSGSTDLEKTLAKYEALVDKYFLGTVDQEKVKESMLKGYFEGLGDKYTTYISPEEMTDYKASIVGNFVGIGVYMSVDTNADKVVIVSPIENSPAAKAGIQAGDYIVSVDGTKYTAKDSDTVASVIKGEEGTNVTVGIERNGEYKEYTIKREKIVINPIKSKMLENNIGYIKVSSFDEGTGSSFVEKYRELENQGIQSLVIDLRNNGGGIVDEAITMLNEIVEKDKPLLITTDKNGKEEITYASKDPTIKVPIVVLVNGNTASSSEIFSGALKDLGKAKIVGNKTYGKGVIQEFLSLSDGSGVKITTEEYCTPNRNKINKVGIEPDVTVDLPSTVTNTTNIKDSDDTQLQKAIEILKNK